MAKNDGRVVSNFIVQALKNQPVTVYGDGSQTRSFCYVSDMIDGFVKLMESDDSVVGPVNLGDPAEMSILEIAQKIIDMTGSDSKIIFRPLPSDDPVQRRPDISLAREKLGWLPEIGLDQGLSSTIKYFKTILN